MKPESSDLYLSAVYHLHERREAVTTSSLAEELGVSMASVSEMLRKLGERPSWGDATGCGKSFWWKS